MEFILRKASDWDFDGEGIDKKFNPKIKEYKNNYENILKGCFIEINTLEELMEFYEMYGQIIIQSHCLNKKIKEIFIYDDYIE